MNEITKIELQKHDKNRVNIFIDGQYAFPLSVETTMKYSLKKGMEIDEGKQKELILESDCRVALDKAVSYLSKSLKTKKQIIDYVKNYGYNDIIIEYVVEKLEEYGYINDISYTQRYISTYLGQIGKKKIEYELLKRGIEKEVVQKALTEIETPQEEVEKVLRKKLGDRELTSKDKEKVMRYMIGKGFSYEEIKRAIQKVQNGGDDESWD